MAETLDCPLCDIPEDPESPFDVSWPINDGSVRIIPTLGMLVPGQLMAVTADHVTSFAQFEKQNLRAIHESLDEHETYLRRKFGPYTKVEHGSDNITTAGSGGCIDHAHIHLVPGEDIGERIQRQLPWRPLDTYEGITEFRGDPYIYLGRLSMHFVVPKPGLNGQWTRRQIAESRGIDNWDYATYDGMPNLAQTFADLGWYPKDWNS